MPDDDNRQLIQKDTLTLNDLNTLGGIMVAAQSARFMRLAISSSALMDRAQFVPMRSHTQRLENTTFGSRVLRAAGEGQALGASDRVKPDMTKVSLVVQLFKAQADLSEEVLEDNIERQRFRSTVGDLLAERSALDMDEVGINGDTTSADPFLAQFDGVLKQTTSNTVTASGRLTKSVLRDMVKEMPKQYLRRKRDLVFFTGTDAEIDYRDTLTDRIGVLSDRNLEGDVSARYGGMDVIDVPAFPENLGGGGNETNVVLTDPKNIVFGFWRRIRVDFDHLKRDGLFSTIATLRFDVKIRNEPAVVKATGVTIN